MNRREFLVNSIGLTGATCAGSVFTSCSSPSQVSGFLSGPNKELGHRLRNEIRNCKIEKTLHHDVVIVGGGISGLAAARYLAKNHVDFVLIELEKRTGGNAQYGSNAISSYPLGAHYLPIPGLNDPELIRFLEESNVITGYDQDLPVYNEYFICFDPKERLFINGYWQEGLVPRSGLPAADLAEMKRFHQLMESFKHAKGKDGKEAFCIPLATCSRDTAFTSLDNISFHAFLKEHQFSSSYLYWYVNYCCADDYGALASHVSAWAGIHYFSSRKGVAANVTSNNVLTWPEGNGWLVKQFNQYLHNKVIANSLVYAVDIDQQKSVVKLIDGDTGVCTSITTNKVILATPQFINERILSQNILRSLPYEHFSYAPWMIANLTLTSNLENRHGEPLCWDNVIYGSSAVGYVHANHQTIAAQSSENVITYYLPLLGSDLAIERQLANSRTYQEWYQLIMKDLKKPHPDIESGMKGLDIWVWGHGMIRPSPGFIFGNTIQVARNPIDNKVFFAHSDCSGISIFEEAFYQGTQAAKQVMSL